MQELLKVDAARLHVLLNAPAPTANSGTNNGTLAADLMATDLDHIRQFTHRLGCASVAEPIIEHFEADIHRLSATYLHRDKQTLLNDIRDLRHAVFTMIDTNRQPVILQHLHQAAARLCGLHAHVLMDLGCYPEAATIAATAWVCADHCGHSEVLAWVRSVQSLIAYWDANPPLAVKLAQEGARHASSGPTAARLAGLVARAAAAMGDQRTTYAALNQAAAARDQDNTSDTPTTGLFSFPEALFGFTGLPRIHDLPYVAWRWWLQMAPCRGHCRRRIQR